MLNVELAVGARTTQFNIHHPKYNLRSLPQRALKVVVFEVAKSADEGVRTPLARPNSTFNIQNSTFLYPSSRNLTNPPHL
jgi:hypothetical protein